MLTNLPINPQIMLDLMPMALKEAMISDFKYALLAMFLLKNQNQLIAGLTFSETELIHGSCNKFWCNVKE